MRNKRILPFRAIYRLSAPEKQAFRSTRVVCEPDTSTLCLRRFGPMLFYQSKRHPIWVKNNRILPFGAIYRLSAPEKQAFRSTRVVCEPDTSTLCLLRFSPMLFYQSKRHPNRVPFALVETTGLEPVTPCMSSKYSNQLSYASVNYIQYYTRCVGLCQVFLPSFWQIIRKEWR